MTAWDTVKAIGSALWSFFTGKWVVDVLPLRSKVEGAEDRLEAQTWEYLSTVILALYLGVEFGAAVIFLQDGLQAGLSLLWALGCLATGNLVGFLFGIPRALQRENGKAKPGKPPAGGSGDETSRQTAGSGYKVNTNLEEISDWLTKIIVGMGLIELKRA